MSQRQFHNKSRRGCLQCKKNRTKCDEKKPKCGRCQRISSNCSRADETSTLIFIPSKPAEIRKEQDSIESPKTKSTSYKCSSLTNNHNSDSPEIPEPITIPTSSTEQSIIGCTFTNTERERLKLMNHYTLHTSKSIAEITIPSDRDQSIWSDWVTSLAFQNDFLLYGLLSISALHLALSGTSPQKYTVLAIQHHSLGVSLFQPHLSNITEDNFDAVFAFSSLVILYSFGIQRTSSERGINAIEKLHQVLILVRGSVGVVKADHEAIERSRWSIMFRPLPPDQTLPEELESMLSTLLQRTSSITDTTQKTVCISAIKVLRDNLTMTLTYSRTQLTMAFFPVMSPAEFWVLVGRGEPLALSILANYAVVLWWLRGSVWMEGWGRETVEGVRESLPGEWWDCIEWVVRETGSG